MLEIELDFIKVLGGIYIDNEWWFFYACVRACACVCAHVCVFVFLINMKNIMTLSYLPMFLKNVFVPN